MKLHHLHPEIKICDSSDSLTKNRLILYIQCTHSHLFFFFLSFLSLSLFPDPYDGQHLCISLSVRPAFHGLNQRRRPPLPLQ